MIDRSGGGRAEIGALSSALAVDSRFPLTRNLGPIDTPPRHDVSRYSPPPFDRRLARPAAGSPGAQPVVEFCVGRLPPLQQHVEPGGHCPWLQGCRGVDHGGLVEHLLAKLRNAAEGNTGRPLLLYLCARLRSWRRVVGAGFHVLS